jgi:ADP-L-glycero-D-manno-heptose 6-epimerase
VILLTGHKGFIGQNIHKRFSNKEIYLSDIDTCFKDLLTIPWEKVNEIWHMGAISDTTCTDLGKIHTYNIEYTLNLFETAIQYQIPVNYASSASVYGNLSGIINPLNHYAMSKAMIDLWVKDNMYNFVKINGYRFFNVYGKYEDHKDNQASPVYTFTKQARETGIIKLFKDSHIYLRDFIWVEDVIDCMMMDKSSGIYDVGTSKPISFYRVAELIADKYNAKIETIPFPDHLKDKYQYHTCSNRDFEHQFISVEEYLRI